MPELPEVETIVRTLRPVVLGRRIYRLALLRPDFAHPAGFDWAGAVEGREVASLHRRAKRIVFTLDDGNCFFAHLGMTGRLTYGPSDRQPPKHTHVCIRVARGEIHFTDPRRFGGLTWLGERACDEDLGPEPMSLRPARLARQLAGTRRAIKVALLDQRLIAGLGNIYADEALFLAGIHPMRPADELDAADIARLNRGIKATLRKAIRHRGSTLRDYVDGAGRPGNFQRLHQVYDRAGEPCHSCGALIERLLLGGRSTHFCSLCQSGAMSARSGHKRRASPHR